MKHYCPDCVTELIKEKRKFGRTNKWFVCPECGFRLQDTFSLGSIDPYRLMAVQEANNHG